MPARPRSTALLQLHGLCLGIVLGVTACGGEEPDAGTGARPVPPAAEAPADASVRTARAEPPPLPARDDTALPPPAEPVAGEQAHTERTPTDPGPTERAGTGDRPADDGGASALPPLLARARLAAARTLDALRDDDHRARVRIVWPEAVEAVPAPVEILLVKGYISYALARIVWDGDRATATRTRLGRSWFYNPRGETVAGRSFELDRAAFLTAFRAVRDLAGTRAELVVEPEPLRTGASFGSSSHAPHYVVQVATGSEGEILHREEVRGHSSRDGLRDYGELRHLAVFQLLHELVPVDGGLEVPLAPEAALCVADIEREALRLGSSPQEDLDAAGRILAEAALRVVGQAGGPEARQVVEGLVARLRERDQTDWWVTDLRGEAETALERILVRHEFDAADTAARIRSNPRRVNRDVDTVDWMRAQLFAKDPDGYLLVLVEDLGREEPWPLVFESVDEVVEHFPGDAESLLRPLLHREEAPLRVHVARALVQVAAALPEAYRALDQVARDVTDRHLRSTYFDSHHRTEAVDLLTADDTPAPFRWESGDLHGQIAAPGEDGRMVARLEAVLARRGRPLSHAERIEAHRRVISGPLGPGMMTSLQVLIDLDDRPSVDRMRQVIADLARGPAEVETPPLDRFGRGTLLSRVADAFDTWLAPPEEPLPDDE